MAADVPSAPPSLVSTGVPGLDSVLHGGLTLRAPVLLTGLPGSGKTLLALQVLAQRAREGHRVIYFSAPQQPLSRVVEPYSDLIFLRDPAVREKLLFENLGSSPPNKAGDLKGALSSIIRGVQNTEAKAIAVDSFRPLADMAESRSELWTFLGEFTSQLSQAGCLVLITGAYLLPQEAGLPEFTMADLVLDLEIERQLRADQRTLRVYKSRGPYQAGRHAFTITSEGIRMVSAGSASKPPRTPWR